MTATLCSRVRFHKAVLNWRRSAHFNCKVSVEVGGEALRSRRNETGLLRRGCKVPARSLTDSLQNRFAKPRQHRSCIRQLACRIEAANESDIPLRRVESGLGRAEETRGGEGGGTRLTVGCTARRYFSDSSRCNWSSSSCNAVERSFRGAPCAPGFFLKPDGKGIGSFASAVDAKA
jgi:hypothetical protein